MINEHWLNLFAVCFAGAMTPGPNNIMLAASGMRYGFKRTLPHMSGIPVGFSTVQILTALGVGTLITSLPWLQIVMALLAACYMLYLMWTINITATPNLEDSNRKPLNFFQSASFQIINPKAWIMTVTAAAVYLQGDNWGTKDIFVICCTFFGISLLSMSTWTLIGASMQSHLANPAKRMGFQFLFQGLTFYVAVSLLWSTWQRVMPAS